MDADCGPFQLCDSACLGLQKIFVQNNQLFQIPENLDSLEKLKTILLDGNPMMDPPVEVFSLGKSAIWNYLRESRRQKALAIQVQITERYRQ